MYRITSLDCQRRNSDRGLYVLILLRKHLVDEENQGEYLTPIQLGVILFKVLILEMRFQTQNGPQSP